MESLVDGVVRLLTLTRYCCYCKPLRSEIVLHYCLPFKQIFFPSKIPSFPTEYTSWNFKLITTIQEDWDWITRAFQIYWILNCVLGASHLSWIKWISSNIHGKCFRSRQLILVSHLTAPTVFNLYRNYKWIFINIVEVLFVIKGSLLMKGS